MTKQNYPAEGLRTNCKSSVERGTRSLSNAISNCSFDIPGGFPYAGYLSGLSGRLSTHLNELNSINAKLIKTDNSFQNLSDNLTANATRITDPRIENRERLIV